MITYAGLVLVIIGWCIQLFGKGKDIKIPFILLYILGVGLLVVDGFINGLTVLAILNCICIIIAIAVFIKVKR